MPVKLINKEDIPGHPAAVFQTKEWPHVEQAIKNGIPDGQVISVTMADGKGSNFSYYAINAIRKLCVQNGRKYAVFQRKGTIYISPS